MNLDSLKYALKRASGLTLMDVTQRIKLKIRRHNLQASFQKSPEAFSISRLMNCPEKWILDPIIPSQIPNSLSDSSTSRLGWLKLGDQLIWNTLKSNYPLLSEKLMEKGWSILDGKVTIFGWRELDLGQPPKWSSCFDEEHPEDEWPKDFYWRINYNDQPETKGRDVKLNWEVNRLQFLLTLGACYRFSGEEVFAQSARSLLKSWLESILYPLGTQWSSNLEVALRVLLLTRSCILFSGSDDWDEKFLLRVMASIELHLNHLENELTLHHTQGNHLLGEAASLMQVSILCPFLKKSAQRIEKSSKILNGLIPNLILPDGIYAEQSTSYAKFILEFLLPIVIPRDPGCDKLSSEVKHLIHKSLHALNDISDERCIAPMIGDSDSGSALGFYLDDYWDMSWLLVCGSKIFNDPGLAQKIKAMPPEGMLFLGTDGVDCFKSNCSEAQKGSDPRTSNPLFYNFPNGGLIKAQSQGVSVIFDVGPLGKSPGYEHGHSDGLSVQLWIDDFPVLIDPGTYIYNGNPGWRKYFKGSSAHNVFQFNGLDQSKPLGSFRWISSPGISLLKAEVLEEQFYLSGTITLAGVTWTRHVFTLPDDIFVILDDIRSVSRTQVKMNLVFDPSWRECQDNLLFDDQEANEISVVLLGWEPSSTRFLYGSTQELGGWFSKLYGKLDKTLNLRAQSEFESTLLGATMIGKRLELSQLNSYNNQPPFAKKPESDCMALDWFQESLTNVETIKSATECKLFRFSKDHGKRSS
ncbi:MAG: alginate lyase family protein [Desulfomonilaceae bacterium]